MLRPSAVIVMVPNEGRLAAVSTPGPGQSLITAAQP
jgi:hypothetical protein